MDRPAPTGVAPEVLTRIRELIALQGGGAHEDLVADVMASALKMLKDVHDRGDARLIATAIRELRYSFRLFEPYAERRKVSIFGSARTAAEREDYKLAQEAGRQLTAAGYMVITGAGAGIMQAGHEGAGQENSFGLNIRLPWEQSANPVIDGDEKLITFRYFFTRKLMFIRQSDAIVLFPGGFGTLDEGFEALTLMQTGKSRVRPLILMERPGGTYWKSFDRYTREHLLGNGLISPDDLQLYQITHDPAEAVRWINRFYRNFHSARYVRDWFVIRLQRAPSPGAVAGLNEDFADIMDPAGPLRPTGPLPEEKEDEEFPALPRVMFKFDRRQHGRLRQLIDALNGH
ncbi:MAG TPA: TIGR00730 family Rossman fold protein [Verrucomicrobiota bacterium]|nr:TIGR00730 family Rossman fold protein [Verrucomicrobiota bacterium]